MTRRIPPALGILMVFAAVYSLHQVGPMFAMMVREGFPDAWVGWLLVGASLAQLVTGVAIAMAWRHARLAMLAWTLVSLASAILARDLLAQDGSSLGIVVMYIEALAGPAIAWLVPMFVGDVPRDPRIPRARVVSSSVPVDVEPDHADILARRFDVGVALFGLGLVWIIGTITSHIPTFAMIARADHFSSGIGGLLGILVFLALEVAVGGFAIRAARRLLDPAASARVARRALAMYVVVVLAVTLGRTGLSIVYQLVDGDLSSNVMKMLLSHWIIGAVLSLVIPLFLWRYAAAALVDAPDQPVVRPSPARLAALPAFALLWFAPFLLARVVVIQLVDASVISRGVIGAIGIACAIQGIVHLVAAIATFLAGRSNANTHVASDTASRPSSSDSALRIARIAAIVATVTAALLVALWMLVVVLAESAMRFGQQLPSGPLVQLVACAVTLWWVLRPRRSDLIVS